MKKDVVDSSFSTGRNDWTATGIYRLHGPETQSRFTVRVRVLCDFYAAQSRAVAEVLTPTLTWTELIAVPGSKWHAAAPRAGAPRVTEEEISAFAGQMCDDLAERAAKILDVE